MKNIFIVIIFFQLGYSNEFYYQNNKKIELTSIKTTQKLQNKDSNQTINYYKKDNGQIVGVTQEIIIKLKEKKAINNLIEKYPITIKEKLTNRLYVVEINSIKEIFNISQQLYRDTNVSYVHPNFIKRIDKR